MVEPMAPTRSSGLSDPGWEHGIAQDQKKKKVKCNYCSKVVSGGIYRLKQHLARISGEVTYCDKAPEEVYLKMKAILEGCRSNKKGRHLENSGQVHMNFDSSVNEKEKEACKSKGKQFICDRNVGLNLIPLRSLGYVDPGWQHGVAQDEKKKRVKCNYCEKIVSGGINRFKQHLARIPGEVAPCQSAPNEVYLIIKENMKWHRTGKRSKESDQKEVSSFDMESDDVDEEDGLEEDVVHQMRKEGLSVDDGKSNIYLRKSCSDTSQYGDFEPWPKKSRFNVEKAAGGEATVPCKEVRGKTGPSKVSQKEVYSAICKFFYHAGVPMQAADSLYFNKMLELVARYGQGLVSPTRQLKSGCFLQEEILTIKSYLAEYKASWAMTGCSIMADSWTDVEGRTSVNFLIYCPRGVYFVSSVDVSCILNDAVSLFKLLDKVVEEAGEENVIQVITENTPAYRAAGKMLEEKRRNLFWTPCAVYCIDRMLEGFLKLKYVSECIEKGQKITKFIYNQVWVLNLLKKEFTRGKELLMPSISQHASSFATLHNLLDHSAIIKIMFQSNKWMSCPLSKTEEGKEVEKIVLDAMFWKKVEYVRKSVNPVMQVIQKVQNGGNLSMPYVYNDMQGAKLAIKSVHGDDARKYTPFWHVIDKHWVFDHPLHLAAFFLNPACRYHPDFMRHEEIMQGLNESIARLEWENGRRLSASMQVSDYNSAKADFGTELAISTRTELDPAAWWQQHGISCLELQWIAVRILSQTCLSSCYEHNWSMYDQFHGQRHSRFAQKRWDELVYVHFNLRLRENQLKKRPNSSVSLDSVLIQRMLDDWVGGAEKRSWREDEELNLKERLTCEENYGDDLINYQGGSVEARKEADNGLTSTDAASLAANSFVASDDDNDDDTHLNFYNHHLSD